MIPQSPQQGETELRSPLTPPSKSRSSDFGGKHMKTPTSSNPSQKHHLQTPHTPHHTAKKQSLFTSPVAHQSRPHSSHLQTPDQTPRINRKKGLADAITFESSSSKISGGSVLFPLAQSTVGSGRKVTGNSIQKLSLSNLDLKRSFKIDTEEDLRYSSEEDASSDEKILQKITKKLDFEVPSTPKDQITNEELSYAMHIDDSRHNRVENDDDEVLISRKQLVNPFLENGEPQRSGLQERPDYSRFEHEIELINNKTGKKITQKMDDFQKSIKPRRLFFDMEEPKPELDTPATPTNKVSLNPLNERPHNSEDDDDLNELIRKEKINNPFRSSHQYPPSKGGRTAGLQKTFCESTQIEYINNHTGDKVSTTMDEEQLRIKPKKLNFDGC